MGYFVKINSKTTKKYEKAGTTSFKNLHGFLKSLRFQKTSYLGKEVLKETYYDTPEHLLSRSGIVLSKFDEGKNIFFKVENAAFLSKMLNRLEKEIFIHKIGIQDKLEDHAFYIKDGITALFSTPFSIDLENVINNAKPNLVVTTKAKIYRIVSGSGMRVGLAEEKTNIKNLETKRTYNIEGLTVKLDSENVPLFLDEFNKFNEILQRNCKEYLETNENQFDFARNVTKPIVVEPKEKKKPKKKPAK